MGARPRRPGPLPLPPVREGNRPPTTSVAAQASAVASCPHLDLGCLALRLRRGWVHSSDFEGEEEVEVRVEVRRRACGHECCGAPRWVLLAVRFLLLRNGPDSDVPPSALAYCESSVRTPPLDLRGRDLTGCRLAGCDLTEMLLDGSTVLTKAVFSGAALPASLDFRGAQLSGQGSLKRFGGTTGGTRVRVPLAAQPGRSGGTAARRHSLAARWHSLAARRHSLAAWQHNLAARRHGGTAWRHGGTAELEAKRTLLGQQLR
eukprot:gene16231-biopygen2458